MTPQQFIDKWQHNTLTERAGAQAHFLDLCELLGVDKPDSPDTYCFERGVKKPVPGAAGPMSGSAATSRGNTNPLASSWSLHSSS